MFLFLIVFTISIIYFFIRYANRDEINEEQEKNDFLENKFKHLIGTTATFKDLDVEFKRKVSEIIVYPPLSKGEKWKVYKVLKAPTWLNNDKEILVYEQTDKHLESEMKKNNEEAKK